MPAVPTTRRRWFQFGLGTLLAFMTMAAIFLAYEANWIRQRHQVLEVQLPGRRVMSIPGFDAAPSAPGILWLFGEAGHSEIDVFFYDTRPGHPATYSAGDEPTAEQQEIGMSIIRLFPEAQYWRIGADDTVNRPRSDWDDSAPQP